MESNERSEQRFRVEPAAEMREQCCKLGTIQVVADDEADTDGDLSAVVVDGDGAARFFALPLHHSRYGRRLPGLQIGGSRWIGRVMPIPALGIGENLDEIFVRIARFDHGPTWGQGL